MPKGKTRDTSLVLSSFPHTRWWVKTDLLNRHRVPTSLPHCLHLQFCSQIPDTARGGFPFPNRPRRRIPVAATSERLQPSHPLGERAVDNSGMQRSGASELGHLDNLLDHRDCL